MNVTMNLHPEIQELIDLGRKRKWLSYEELNNTLPDEFVDPDRVDDVLIRIDEFSIELVDELEYKARRWRESKRLGLPVDPEPSRQTELAVDIVDQDDEIRGDLEEAPPAEAEAEAVAKRIDDPVRMYLT
ncbi:MAG: RNA polymerase sigma factor region1.1 domain-containing protein, partial [Phycisphaerales bacterium]|nr:RNA polymerase sigma factor region1.1 domain-containing protein [Phycisphaerales bacterium]